MRKKSGSWLNSNPWTPRKKGAKEIIEKLTTGIAQKSRPESPRGDLIWLTNYSRLAANPEGSGLVVHSAHSAAWWHRRRFFLFRDLGDESLGGQEQATDGRRILQ